MFKLHVLRRNIKVREKDAILLPLINCFDLYDVKLLKFKLWGVGCEKFEADIWDVLRYNVGSPYVETSSHDHAVFRSNPNYLATSGRPLFAAKFEVLYFYGLALVSRAADCMTTEVVGK